MEKDLWICDKNGDAIINLKGCIKIYKAGDINGGYLLKFVYISDIQRNTRISYYDKIHRNNMYDHVITFLNPSIIDSNKKPLTL